VAELSLADTLAEIRFAITTDHRDWSRYNSDAFLYGILVGWECDDAHEHDDSCASDALTELAKLHHWRPERVEQIRALRRAIRAAS
jgi:hypothetical protein